MAMATSRKPYFFIKGNFLSHLLPLAFFHKDVCVHKVVHVVFSSVFAL